MRQATRRCVHPLLTMVLLGFAAPAFGQQVTSVRIHVLAIDGSPVPGALIRTAEGGILGIAGPDGRTLLEGVAGDSLALTVSHPDHSPMSYTLRLGAPLLDEIQIVLDQAPVEVEGVNVVAERTERALRLSGYYMRMQSGVGKHLGPDDLQRGRVVRLSDAFRAMTGVRVVALRGGQAGHALVSSRQPPSLKGGTCPMTIYLDGAPLGSPNIDQIRRSEVAGVEVYRSAAELPAGYNATGAACGVILVWTQR